MCYSPIHQSIAYLIAYQLMVTGKLEPIPVVGFDWEVGYTLGRSPVFHRANTVSNIHSFPHPPQWANSRTRYLCAVGGNQSIWRKHAQGEHVNSTKKGPESRWYRCCLTSPECPDCSWSQVTVSSLFNMFSSCLRGFPLCFPVFSNVPRACIEVDWLH